MRETQFRYNKLKKLMTDNEKKIILVSTKYDRETGEPEDVENLFDPTIIPDRIKALQNEVIELQELQNKIENEELDEVEDKRQIKTAN